MKMIFVLGIFAIGGCQTDYSDPSRRLQIDKVSLNEGPADPWTKFLVAVKGPKKYYDFNRDGKIDREIDYSTNVGPAGAATIKVDSLFSGHYSRMFKDGFLDGDMVIHEEVPSVGGP